MNEEEEELSSVLRPALRKEKTRTRSSILYHFLFRQLVHYSISDLP